MNIINIILCNNKNDNIDIFKNYNPYIYTKRPYELIDGKFVNPPFFQIVIVNETSYIINVDIKLLYNTVIVEGLFIIPEKYYYLFDKSNFETQKYKQYIIIKKKNKYYLSF